MSEHQPPASPMRLSRLRAYFRLPHRKKLTHPHPWVGRQQASVSLNSTHHVWQVDPAYLSFSIDISVLAGGFWWEGSKGQKKGLGTLRVPPLDLDSKKLDRLVQALGTSYVRVGGSEADKIHYFDSVDAKPDDTILTREMWDKLHRFISRNNLRFFFTFKYGLFKRRQHGEWQGTEIQELLQYSRQKGYRLDVCELGNEFNAYWAFHGLQSQPGPKNLAQDYATFAQLIKRYYPTVKICGPGSAYWPKLGEAIKPLPNLTKGFLENLPIELDIVDWHYYPFQSDRSPIRTRAANVKNVLHAQSFEYFARYAKRLREWRDIYQPGAEIWTGESGSAQCGGQAKISDRFASCFWWADQLGQGAVQGQKVMIRQSLLGGDYGMVDRESLKPRPDYWVSWLWVRLMGEQVYSVQSNNPDLRVYCHQSHDTSDLWLLLINIANDHLEVDTQSFSAAKEIYSLTAGKLTAKRLRINGIKPSFNKGNITLSDFPQPSHSNKLPPNSINFWRVAINQPVQ